MDTTSKRSPSPVRPTKTPPPIEQVDVQLNFEDQICTPPGVNLACNLRIIIRNHGSRSLVFYQLEPFMNPSREDTRPQVHLRHCDTGKSVVRYSFDLFYFEDLVFRGDRLGEIYNRLKNGDWGTTLLADFVELRPGQALELPFVFNNNNNVLLTFAFLSKEVERGQWYELVLHQDKYETLVYRESRNVRGPFRKMRCPSLEPVSIRFLSHGSRFKVENGHEESSSSEAMSLDRQGDIPPESD